MRKGSIQSMLPDYCSDPERFVTSSDIRELLPDGAGGLNAQVSEVERRMAARTPGDDRDADEHPLHTPENPFMRMAYSEVKELVRLRSLPPEQHSRAEQALIWMGASHAGGIARIRAGSMATFDGESIETQGQSMMPGDEPWPVEAEQVVQDFEGSRLTTSGDGGTFTDEVVENLLRGDDGSMEEDVLVADYFPER